MRRIILILLPLIIFNCSASKKVAKEEKCPKIYKNSYASINNEVYKAIKEKDTASYFEISYECVFSAFYTHKVMYETFGKWDKVIYPSNSKHPILVWKDVDLFSNGKKYKVYTKGIEEWKHIYASVMVFDNNGNDLLTMGSSEREQLTQYFANLIKKHDPERKEFFEAYWMMVDPEMWKNRKS